VPFDLSVRRLLMSVGFKSLKIQNFNTESTEITTHFWRSTNLDKLTYTWS